MRYSDLASMRGGIRKGEAMGFWKRLFALNAPATAPATTEVKSLITGAPVKIKNKTDAAPRKTKSKSKARV